jgi:amino acid adenylation domain-containing protein
MMDNSENNDLAEGIAIIGMECRFPGAKNIDVFWRNLREGVEAISFFTDQELKDAGVDPSLLQNPYYVKAGAVLEDIELFDASFFGFNPREVEITDPQHRLFLECSWSALEQAGYNPETYKGRIGVYAGVGMNTYLLSNIYQNRDIMGSMGDFQVLLGSDKDFLSTRVSYKLNLRGPSITLQTACSTSLVAVYISCQSLLNYQCDMALAGGVSIRVPHRAGYLYQEKGVLSPDGHCRAFDANAGGFVLGNGAGIVVLKRLEDALADGDCIYAVIRGSAINNDGSAKVSYTAPGVEGQAEVIAKALALAEVHPETISYVETHGSATALGDVVEIAALTQAFRAHTQKRGFCAIGSVKTNIGHVDAAAGVAGLIKTVLALRHRQIPPSLHFERPNPHIDFANSPFFVNTTLAAWKAGDTPRRAGVSSFGIGGTNVHLILEEAPAAVVPEPTSFWHLLVLSARSNSALETATDHVVAHLKQYPELTFADVAYTFQVGRNAFGHRRMLVCIDQEDAITALEARDPKRVVTGFQETRNRPVAFMFSGIGDQYAHMAQELYEHEPAFQVQLDRCSELLKTHLGMDIRDVLYPSPRPAGSVTSPQPPAGAARQTDIDMRTMLASNSERADPTSPLRQTYLAQPVLFVIEYAMARLWMEWGIHPQALIGYSTGEYVAACLAGVLSLEDALMLVAQRAKLIQALPASAMLAVSLSEQEVHSLLGEHLSLAAISGPSLCVLAGPTAEIDTLARQLTSRGVACRQLQTSHAFHSKMMEPIVADFVDLIRRIDLQPPRIPYISNVTGTWITPAQATDTAYWAKHLCQTVRFADGVHQLLQEPDLILLEVGPGQTLCSLVMQQMQSDTGDRERVVLPSIRPMYDRRSDRAFVLNTLGRLWLAGVPVDWARLYTHRRPQRLPLPIYPFERQRYWIEPQHPTTAGGRQPEAEAKKLDVEDWFYIPSWKRAPLSVVPDHGDLADPQSSWLIFMDDQGLGSSLAIRLEQAGQHVITASVGSEFRSVGPAAYMIDPRQRDDYDALFAALRTRGVSFKRIVHLWTVGIERVSLPADNAAVHAQDLGFYSLLFLAQALGSQPGRDTVRIDVVSNNMYDITGKEHLCPEKVTVLGPCKVIPQEYPHISCRTIDVELPDEEITHEARLIDQLLMEFAVITSDTVVAYRGRHRWAQFFDPVRLVEAPSGKTRLRAGGVYLITGGLGGVGLILAGYLARTVQARLILVGRSMFPGRDEWEQWLTTRPGADRTSQKIRAVQALEAEGAEVLVVSADVASSEQMQDVIRQAQERFGAIHGVIHAAGIAGGGVIQIKTPDMAARVFAPKLHGTRVLGTVLKDARLDFFVLCSSINAIVGTLGQVDYCAANAYLDAFACQYSARYGMFTLAINWDTWQVGMAIDSAVPDQLKHWREALLANAILPTEGVEVFARVLRSELPQVIVSTRNLHTAIEQSYSSKALEAELARLNSARPAHPRPNLSSAYVAPRSAIEQAVADIWQKLLGVERVGIHDNFFELGGHSLLATQLISTVRSELRVTLPLHSLFETPTVADLAAAIMLDAGEQIAPADAISALDSVTPDRNQQYEPFPLNDIQQAYWIGRSGDFDLGNVSIHGYLEVESTDLDLPQFNLALQRLIDRHAMMRAIVQPDGQQRVLEHVPPYHIEVLDLRGQDPEAVTRQLEAVRRRMSHQVLPLDRWPLFEFRASRLDDERIRLHISVDGMIADAWSANLLTQDLVRLYTNLAAPFPALEFSFRDYVLAEIALRDSEQSQRSQTYWRRRLDTLPPAPELPLTKNPGALAQPHFERLSAELEPDAWLRLKARAAQADLTPAGLLLAVYAEVLATWSAGQHFTINIPRFNRLPLYPQVNSIVGQFASFTLLEVNSAESPSFEARAKRIQKQLWEDMEHSYVSGVSVLRELARTRGRTSGAIMPVVFTSMLYQGLERGADTLISMPDKLGTIMYMISQTPQVWLDLQVTERAGALVLDWDAVDELFPEGLMRDMFSGYCSFLHRLAEEEIAWQEPAPRLVPRAQLAQRAVHNATETPVAADLLQTLFAAQVSKHAHRSAVISTRRTLTYEELSGRSNRVGRRLRMLGARPNTLVAICMDKGWEQIVAVLGVLQSGAAYLPVDPTFPKERIHYLLEHGQVELVLTQSWLDGVLAWPESVRRLCVDDEEYIDGADQPLEPVQQPADLAYVLYTSGSTGLPKGVMIEHRSVVNRMRDVNQRFDVRGEDRALALTALQHDLSVYDIFGMLTAGGAIVIPDATSLRDPAHWAALMAREQVTVWNSVPAFMEMFVDYLAQAVDSAALLPPSLRLVLLSGDWIPLTLPDRLRCLVEGVQVVSLGGPTETTVWDICYPIQAVDPQWRSIPYGRPMTNARYYVLNDRLEPCPVWVPGQLYIGGVGLARGYWRDAVRTGASFVPHPITGERLYRSGDIGRYLPDGPIEFLGRADFQVKIRGYRIELGEIEAALEQHPAVRGAVVTATNDAQGNKRLVAYVETQSAEGRTTNGPEFSLQRSALAGELRGFLKEKLPEYMLPAVFLILDSFPLSRNGKIDRKLLPAPEQAQPDGETAFVAPRTPVEETLAQLWADLLGVERVSIHANFFDLGGHSLSATRIMSSVRTVFQVEIPLRILFEEPTVAGMALAIARSQGTRSDETITPIKRRDRSQAQKMLADIDQLSDEQVEMLLRSRLK